MGQDTTKTGNKAAWAVLFLLVILYASDFIARMIFSVSMEAIKAEFEFSDTQIGMLQSAFFVGLAMFTIPVSVLVDKWTRKSMITLMSTVWSLATVATGYASGFATAISSRFICGVGCAGFAPAGMSWISAIFPQKKRATAMGVFNIGTIIGSILGMGVGGVIISKTGDWRFAYIVFGVPCAIIGLLTLLFPEPKKDTGNETRKVGIFSEMGNFFRIKTYRLMALGSGFYLVLAVAVQTWAIVLMMRAYGLDSAKAGGIMSIMIFPALAAPFMGGVLADRLQRKIPHGRPLFCACFGLISITTYAVQFATAGIIPLWGYIVLMLIAGLTSSSPMPVYNTVIQDVLPPKKRATGASVVIFIQYAVFNWWGATLVGKISDMAGGGVEGLRIGLLTLIPFALVALLMFYRGSKHYVSDLANAEGRQVLAN